MLYSGNNMIIVRFAGGIGNQLFQYSFGQYIQKKLQTPVFYDIEGYNGINKDRTIEIFLIDPDIEIKRTNINFAKYGGIKKHLLLSIYRILSKKKYIKENNHATFESIEKFLPDIEYYFDGYWQYPSIAEEIRPKIIDNISSCKKKMPLEIESLQKRILSSSNSVSIHIRRGDYFSKSNSKFYAVCDLEYYYKAIDYIQSTRNDATFFIFSDDTKWVEKNFKPKIGTIDIIPIYNVNSFWYLYLMSQCNDNIISNSSFSWWGAFLNNNKEKVIITPRKWNLVNDHTIALKEWVKI